MGDEEHGDLALQLIDGRGKVLGRIRIQAARRFIEDEDRP
jgi:hypothetical protein